MNYAYQYFKLIVKRVERPASLDADFVEIHHIIPSSEGGSDDKTNLVELTAREHYVAHLLLAKIYDDYKMYCALTYMKNAKGHDLKVNGRLFEALRRRQAQFVSRMNEQRKGSWHWWNNGEIQVFCPSCPDGFVKGMIPGRNNRRKMSEESKRKNSASHVGKTHSDETRAKISNANLGRTVSEETKLKISKSLKGRTGWAKGRRLSEEHKRKLSESRRVHKKIKVVFVSGDVCFFDGVREAAAALNCFSSVIYSCMKHGQTWRGIKFEAE